MDDSADKQQQLAEAFAGHEVRLRAIAYRMLGSLPEAEDAVQDTWIRLARTGAAGVGNLGGWLTTVLVRVCLNLLQARAVRREDAVGGSVPDAIVSPDGVLSPEDEAVLADSVGLALSVVLDTLAPAERVAFVLHDLFDVAFDEVESHAGGVAAHVTAQRAATRARPARRRDQRVRGAAAPAAAGT